VTPFARKRFGQNFLEPAWVDKVIRAIDPKPDECFVEIGPGRGALTLSLAARASAVIAYEIDRDLAAELETTAPQNVAVVVGNFLEIFAIPDSRIPIPESRIQNPDSRIPNPESRFPNPFRVAGNLPYNVGSPILFRLVELFARGLPLVDATVMLQREVADRLLAQPGTKDYGVLTVLIRHSASVERLLALPPGAFRPAPRVHSSLVRLRFHSPDPPVHDPKMFAAIVQAVFTRRRKTLANALLALGSESRSESASGSESESGSGSEPEPGSDPVYPVYTRLSPADALSRALLDGRRRAETLSIAEFAQLADVYASISR
jgi:16S rRNA (adenine1518-N6/adenine1519-N6)-dimethyltransferase